MRAAVLIGSLALGLPACAPEGDKGSGGSGYPGYELASARTAKSASTPVVQELTVDQLVDRMATRNIRLIDVRSDDEVAEGMIPGAEHIAMDQFDPAKVVSGDPREIVIYCRSGRRSQTVAEKLAAYTGKPAVHLAGGILAWQEAGKAVTAPN